MTSITPKTLISEMFALKATNADVGIEIEAEGNLTEFTSTYWKTVPDGSLRNGMEYVLRKPISIKNVPDSMQEFRENTQNFRFRDSFRTSVHVHVNAQHWTVGETFAVIAAFWLVENAFVHLHGEMREGNLFCLRAKDAEGFVRSLCSDLNPEILTVGAPIMRRASPASNKYFNSVLGDQYRYSSLNLTSLPKYGSVEFRFLKGTTDTAFIQWWVEELFNLTQSARVFRSPEAVLGLFDELGPRAFAERLLSPRLIAEFDQHMPGFWANKIQENYPYAFELVNSWQRAHKQRYKAPVINVPHEDIDAKRYRKPPPEKEEAKPQGGDFLRVGDVNGVPRWARAAPQPARQGPIPVGPDPRWVIDPMNLPDGNNT